jgi:hypothetical protein
LEEPPSPLSPPDPPKRRRREHFHHLAAFEAWHKNDRHFRKTVEELGRSANPATEKSLYQWANEFNWRARADARDLELEQAANREAVKRQQKLLEKQRKAGELLRMRGLEHFADHKITNPAVALKAVSKGIELERQAEGLPTWILELQQLSDDELAAEKQRLLRLALIEAQSGGPGDGEEEGEDEPGEARE